jgi:ABC-type multidrug transport system fused ATPase/permease subunit
MIGTNHLPPPLRYNTPMTSPPPTLTSLRDKLRFFLSVLKEHKKLLIGHSVVSVLVSLLYAVIPYFLKLQVDQLEQQSTTFGLLTGHPLVIFLILLSIPFVLEFINSIVLRRLATQFSIQLSAHLRNTTERMIWNKLSTLDAGFFQSKRTQKMLKESLRSTSIIDQMFHFVNQRLSSLISFGAILPLLALVSWQLVVLIIGVAGLQYVVSQALRKKGEVYSLMESITSEELWRTQSLLEFFFYEVKMMGAIETLIDRYQGLRIELDNLEIKRERSNFLPDSMGWLLDNGLILTANIFIGSQVMNGTISIGSFMLVVAYTQQINQFFKMFFRSVSEWQDIDFSLAKLGFLFALKSRIKTVADPQRLSQAATTAELRAVDFSYPDHGEDERKYLDFLLARLQRWVAEEGGAYYKRELAEVERLVAEKHTPQQVLKNVSLTLERGKIVAVVGRNGSGKTTSTHLLQHHYEPDAGAVLLDGIPLTELDQTQVIEHFSWLTQTPFILARQSLRENIFLGSKQTPAVKERAEQVLQALKLDSIIAALPKQLDTIMDEDTSFSGGQQQLLAIARCLIQRRPFIIFDEGSSQLDVEKEFLVLQQLQKAKEHSGILFITHRMSVARKADYIYVIDDGAVVQEGTHQQMIAQPNSLYAQFWAMQTVE